MFRRLFGHKGRESLTLKIFAVIEPDEGRFHAFAPAFKGLHVDGKDEQEAIRNLTNGIGVYLESLAIHKEPLPIGPNLIVHEDVEIPQGAFLRSVTVEWPSLQTSGIS
jgi:predicted RNase H-like HicB family nuclease